MATNPKIHVDGLAVDFPQGAGKKRILDRIDLTIARGELLCLLGPSGCGKSTLLNAIAGFVTPSAGRVSVDGKRVTAPSPQRIVLFQDGGLLPWRTAEDNVALGLEAKGIKRRDARDRARGLLARVGLAEAAGQFPRQLSGGMQQRVALARALAMEPDILLLDEPFGALDAFTRFRIQDLLLDLWESSGTTMVLVTHDLDEAVYLARRVVLLAAQPGRIAQEILLDIPRPADRAGRAIAEARREVFEAFAALDSEASPKFAPSDGAADRGSEPQADGLSPVIGYRRMPS